MATTGNTDTNQDVNTVDEAGDAELHAALGRLRWVVPGRGYSDRMIDDVKTVLAHFGMSNAHGDTVG